MQTLTSLVTSAQTADRRAAARASRRARAARTASRLDTEPIVLRRARPDDSWALKGLADLDSAPRPTGEMLVAEVDGRISAAVPVGGGRAIADPFQPTAGLVEMLRIRAAASADHRPAPDRGPRNVGPPTRDT